MHHVIVGYSTGEGTVYCGTSPFYSSKSSCEMQVVIRRCVGTSFYTRSFHKESFAVVFVQAFVFRLMHKHEKAWESIPLCIASGSCNTLHSETRREQCCKILDLCHSAATSNYELLFSRLEQKKYYKKTEFEHKFSLPPAIRRCWSMHMFSAQVSICYMLMGFVAQSERSQCCPWQCVWYGALFLTITNLELHEWWTTASIIKYT